MSYAWGARMIGVVATHGGARGIRLVVIVTARGDGGVRGSGGARVSSAMKRNYIFTTITELTVVVFGCYCDNAS
jgi:hypothetical protein